MTQYIIRRTFYSLPIIIGVCLLTFFLFYVVISPENMARKHLGSKQPTQEDLQNWIKKHGYDKPLIINTKGDSPFDSIFFHHMKSLLLFDFGVSDKTQEPVADIIRRGIWPSLMLAIPSFILSLLVDISFALFVAYKRNTYLDRLGVFICVLLMSVSVLIYIIAGQWLLAYIFKYFPVFGWDKGFYAAKFIYLPLVIALISGIGGSVRFYRTIMLEEISQDYVRTARAKGLSEERVLFVHVLKNSLIPILTSVVLSIPFLFMGSLLLETFFGIPGLGSLTMDAINASDFSVLRTIVYIGSILYIIGALLTDISYTLVDPRIRFK